eukprot:4067647-Prymnesium_polylepis.1
MQNLPLEPRRQDAASASRTQRTRPSQTSPSWWHTWRWLCHAPNLGARPSQRAFSHLKDEFRDALSTAVATWLPSIRTVRGHTRAIGRGGQASSKQQARQKFGRARGYLAYGRYEDTHEP